MGRLFKGEATGGLVERVREMVTNVREMGVINTLRFRLARPALVTETTETGLTKEEEKEEREEREGKLEI